MHGVPKGGGMKLVFVNRPPQYPSVTSFSPFLRSSQPSFLVFESSIILDESVGIRPTVL